MAPCEFAKSASPVSLSKRQWSRKLRSSSFHSHPASSGTKKSLRPQAWHNRFARSLLEEMRAAPDKEAIRREIAAVANPRGAQDGCQFLLAGRSIAKLHAPSRRAR